jgi:hypothetical protein
LADHKAGGVDAVQTFLQATIVMHETAAALLDQLPVGVDRPLLVNPSVLIRRSPACSPAPPADCRSRSPAHAFDV